MAWILQLEHPLEYIIHASHHMIVRDYNCSMLRAASLVLLFASLPALLNAQRSTGMAAMQGGIAASHPNFGGHPGVAAGSRSLARGHQAGHGRHKTEGYGFGAFPYFLPDYETGWPEGEETPEQANKTSLVRVTDDSARRESASPVPAQVIEIPDTKKSTQTNPLPATVFVLTDGEKLETGRYLLTANSLSLTIHRAERTIPLRMLDVDATVAANRNRGIDLRIPSDQNEISLRF
jgi:hypothetical protein